jgi:tricorn protease
MTRFKNRCRVLLATIVSATALMATDAPLLLQKPTLSASEIAFVYAGDLWIVGRKGGAARRLTSGAGIETNPHFSPDGTEIAFTGEYDGNVDVYVVAAAGGVPRRLTWHPAPDQTAGWSPDGKQLLFSSNRNSYSRFSRLFTVSRNGGMPVELPLPIAAEGSYSADSSRLAYVPLDRAFSLWKRYRGGRASLIWIAALADSSIEKIPRDNSNDFNPMWVGENIYFLSDRNGAVSLFAYDTRKKTVSEILHNDGSQWRADRSCAMGDCRHPGCDNVKYAGGATSQPNHAATGDANSKARRHGGSDRSKGMEADVPRSVPAGARFLLRSWLPRSEPGGDGEAI